MEVIMEIIKEIEMGLAKYVGGKFSSRKLSITTYFYKLGLKDGLKDKGKV